MLELFYQRLKSDVEFCDACPGVYDGSVYGDCAVDLGAGVRFKMGDKIREAVDQADRQNLDPAPFLRLLRRLVDPKEEFIAAIDLVEQIRSRGRNSEAGGARVGVVDEPSEPPLTPEAKAILFIQREVKTKRILPSKTAIAKELGVDRRTLYNWTAFKVAYAKMNAYLEKSRPPARGWKTEDGMVDGHRESGK